MFYGLLPVKKKSSRPFLLLSFSFYEFKYSQVFVVVVFFVLISRDNIILYYKLHMEKDLRLKCWNIIPIYLKTYLSYTPLPFLFARQRERKWKGKCVASQRHSFGPYSTKACHCALFLGCLHACLFEREILPFSKRTRWIHKTDRYAHMERVEWVCK